MAKLRLCFKIHKSVGLAEDENGEKSEAYICTEVTVETYELERKKYENLQDAFTRINAALLGIEIDKIAPITLNEYLDKTEEE